MLAYMKKLLYSDMPFPYMINIYIDHIYQGYLIRFFIFGRTLGFNMTFKSGKNLPLKD